ncbi:MAG: hypothetical protein ACU0A2_10375, partial [Cognatishimia sp.]|uniref:hypothetical protein n=1 Tax=Cognatishimia sp. TaxID=2211648 RepID=UPI004058DE3F
MPNILAYLVLGLWPLVLLGLFRALPPGRALIWSVLLSYLILPPYPMEFDFPLLPSMNKTTIPNVMALILAVKVAKHKINWLPETRIGKVLALMFVLAPLPTVLTNGEPIVFAMDAIRGLYTQDIFAMMVTQVMLLANFILARQLLTTEKDLRDLLLAIVIAGTAYTLPMLIEVRLSPQINIWVYGYFQHMFDQVIRAGGYRPLVFLEHGIWASMLVMMTLTATVILIKNTEGVLRQRLIILAWFLGGMLVLTKTLSMLIYGLFMVSMVLFATTRMQARAAVLLAVLALAYPTAKGLDLIPEERILALAERASADRAQSLEFRFSNEEELLERAALKPWFGWGIWGRNQIHDPITGRQLSVTDGRWILVLGMMGWLGFFGEFGLLVLPIFMIYRASKPPEDPPVWTRRQHAIREELDKVLPANGPQRGTASAMSVSLALLLAVNTVDLLPNATLTTLTWLIAGALLGYAERVLGYAKPVEEPEAQLSIDPLPRRARTVL